MNKLILTIIIIISINGEYISPRLEDNCGRVTRVKEYYGVYTATLEFENGDQTIIRKADAPFILNEVICL